MIKSDSLAKLAPALVKAQKNMGIALKDAKNPFFKSKYADLNAIIDAAVPALNAEGIAVLQSPGLVADPVTGVTVPVIETILLHESGEFVVGQSRVIAAKQNDPQAEGSATTYARRYGLQAMAVLKADDDDGNAGSGKVVTTTTVTPKATATVITKQVTATEVVAAAEKEVNEVVQAAVAAPKKAGWGDKKKAAPAPSSEDLY